MQYFQPSLSYHLSSRPLFCLFFSGCLRQVLLYAGFERKTFEILHYIISVFLTGLLESNADENSPNPSPSVTSKTARPSLAKIILSQDSDVAKQLALSHVLTALQITYARYRKCSKILNTFLFLFSNKMLIFRARIHKMLVRIANSSDSDQTASSEAVWSGSALLV